jgi:hypothetical protein
LQWVAEDTGATKEIPFPNVCSKNLQMALDVVHELASLDDSSLADVECAAQGFDLLGCTIDVIPRVWAIVKATADIYQLRARLPVLMRAESVDAIDVLRRAVVLAPRFEDVLTTIHACEPDYEMAVLLSTTLAKMYPVGALVKEICRAVTTPGMTLEQAMRVTGCDGVGTYTHPHEVAEILAFLRDRYRSAESSVWGFVRAMAGAMHVYDVAPLSCATFGGSVISFHDSNSTSIMLVVDGPLVRRRVNITKWLKFSIEDMTASVYAASIDPAARTAKCLDLRMFVELTSGARAEMMYSWFSPLWMPATEAKTDRCGRVIGDKDVFDSVVETGKFARKMTIRIDVFFGDASIVTIPAF